MEISAILMMFFYLMGAHWLGDYPLQGAYLADTKKNGPLRVYHLIAHSGIHGFLVLLVTGSLLLGVIEWVLHTITDELKNRNYLTFAQDQAVHINCKIFYVFLMFTWMGYGH